MNQRVSIIAVGYFLADILQGQSRHPRIPSSPQFPSKSKSAYQRNASTATPSSISSSQSSSIPLQYSSASGFFAVYHRHSLYCYSRNHLEQYRIFQNLVGLHIHLHQDRDSKSLPRQVSLHMFLPDQNHLWLGCNCCLFIT